MKKSKVKYPDGGPLTLTTGTPEYNDYLAKKKLYEENAARHKYATTSGYTEIGLASQAEIGSITPKLANPDTNATQYKVYSYDPSLGSPTATGSEFFDSASGKFYIPYYESPGEANIIKSQADLDAEKQAAEAEEFKSKYQGYVTTQVPVQNEDGTWKMTTEARPFPVGQDAPVDGTFHQQLPAGATVVQYAGGGKFGSYVGDSAKMIGDTLLSTIGLSDVISDEAYKNQKMADASRVAETVGKYTGQIAGNILLPGIGGAAVKTGQNILSNVDGEDERREYMDNIASLQSQGALGKFNAGAYSTPNGLNETNAIVTGMGEIGNVLSNPGTISSIKDSVSNFKLPTFPMGGMLDKRKQPGITLRPNKYGTQNYFDYVDNYLRESYVPTVLTDEQGNTRTSSYDSQVGGQTEKIGLLDSIKMANRINKNTRESGRDVARVRLNAFVDRSLDATPSFAEGGKFVEYNGPTHANGGVPIDQNGMPNQMMKSAEVEGGETMHDNGIDKYIFSDRLVVDPKSKITFAEASKKINNKYKGNLDKIQKESRDAELKRLKQEQEAFKQSMMPQQMNQSMMATGGPIKPKPKSTREDLITLNSDRNDLILEHYYKKGLQYWNGKFLTEEQIQQQLYPIDKYPNLYDSEGKIKLNRYASGGNLPNEYGFVPYSPEYLSEMEEGNFRMGSTPISTIPVSRIEDIPINMLPVSKINKPINRIPSSYIEESPTEWQMQYSPVNKIQTPINRISSNPVERMGETNPNYIEVNDTPLTFDELAGDMTIYDENGNPYVPRSQRLQQIIDDSNATKTTSEDQLPQDKISPLGYAASNIGNVYDLFQAAKPAKANDFGRVSLEGINLDPQRKELEKQANLARNINRENVRSLATSSGQALTNQVIGNALANSTLGSGLSESFMAEINANNQIKNQEELTNFQTKQNEILADQQDKAMRQSVTSQALHGIGMNTQGYARDIKSTQVGNKNNEMWFNAIKDSGQYVSLGTDANGNMVFKSKISGEIITKQI